MGNHFETEFLSNISFLKARELFNQERPGFDTLNSVIDKLVEQQAIDKLSILFTLLKEEENTEDHTQLKARILGELLLHALDNSHQEKIKAILNDLEICLIEKQHLWQGILSSIILWIEHHNQNDDIMTTLLTHLPNTQRERLYERLLETAQDNPPWLASLIAYILSKRSSKNIASSHLGKLASSIVLSPTTCSSENMNYLTLMLTTDQLVNLTFQLRAMAATYASDGREKHTRFTERRQSYLNKYDVLAMALTVRATSSKTEYEQLVTGNSELANILLMKRLLVQTNPSQQKDLIIELLENPNKYDLSDSAFKATATTSLATVFANLPTNELIPYFKKYYIRYTKKNLAEVICFLDTLYDMSYDRTKILSCIQAIDDEDKTITINYIAKSKSRDNGLTETCLSTLNEKQLITFCGHILALKQVLRQEIEPLSSVYFRVLCKKISLSLTPDHLASLAQTLKLLPEEIISDSLKIIFSNFKDNTQLRYQWLNVLFAEQFSKTMLLSPCQELLKMLRLPEQLSLLRCFFSGELLALYLYAMRQNASESDLQCFVELLKETDRQPQLLYLLLNTPMINQAFLDKLMPFIDDKNLITLIFQLLDKEKTDRDYATTLDPLLCHFCYRLQLALDEHAPIHQWVGWENSGLLATHLLENPESFQILCSRSSLFQDFTPSLLQGYLVNNASTDLKLRANRLLNLIVLDSQKAEKIAFNLLSHYQSSPKKLQTIFINLEAAQETLNEQGKKNYTYLKQACWRLLQAKSDSYDENHCVTLLTTQLTLTHCFDPLLAKLAINVCESQDAHLSAQYLTQIETSTLEQIQVDYLAKILTKSLSENTKSNWEKVAIYLKNKDKEQTLALIKSLIAQIKDSNNNPILIDKTTQFILNLPNLESLISLFTEEELCWLVRETKATDIIDRFPAWFNQLITNKQCAELNYGSLIISLPLNQSLLDAIYQHEDLKPHFHTIFLQLVSDEAAPVHFIALFRHVITLPPEDKHHFITQVQKLIRPQNLQGSALLLINITLLSLPSINVNKEADVTLVLKHLNLITDLLKQNKESSRDSQYCQELEQLVLNTLSCLTGHNLHWAHKFLASESFAECALIWLKEVDVKTIGRHPLTKILLEYTNQRLPANLINDGSYQRFIKQLLSSPPTDMNDDQFTILFETLTSQNQQQLAVELLQRPTISDVQWSSLMTLARALPVSTLYSIYTKSKTRFVFVDLLARNPMGLAELGKAERNTLLADLSSGKQILRILDSYSPVSAKTAFVDAIFAYLEEKNIPLAQWFETMNIDSQTLAAFANYTINEKNKAKLMLVIEKSLYLSQGIGAYLRNPTLDMAIEQRGLLYTLLQQGALNPWLGCNCNPRLVQALEPDIIRETIKAHFELWNQVNELNAFYEPLSATQEVASQILTSARWVQRLPLISEGVLEVIGYLRSHPSDQTVIEQTELYQQIIIPLLLQKNLDSLAETQLNRLFNLLVDYAQSIKNVDDSHYQKIKVCIQNYQLHLQVMEHFSDSRLIQLFKPNSYMGRIINGKINHLREVEVKLISTALLAHQQWFKSQQLIPVIEFAKLLQIGFGKLKVFEDRGFRNWLLQYGLFSPLTNSLSDEFIKELLGKFPHMEFSLQMAQLHRKQMELRSAYQDLKNLVKTTSLQTLIRELYLQPLNNLKLQRDAAAFAHKPNLTNLLLFVIQAKEACLDESQLQELLLPKTFTNHLEMDWFLPEIEKLREIENTLTTHTMRITILGFSFNNDKQDIARLTNLKQSFVKTDQESMAAILNSYLPVFVDKKNELLAKELLYVLEKLYLERSKTQGLLKKLSPDLLAHIIHFALNEPVQHEELLQQIIHAGFGLQFQKALNNILISAFGLESAGKENSEKPFLVQFSLKQFANLTASECENLIISQRLLFQIKPVPELTSWHSQGQEAHVYFCADASIFSMLMQWQEVISQHTPKDEITIEAQQNINYCFDFFSKETKGLAYYKLMEKFHQEVNKDQPAVYYHWLCLLSFLSHDKTVLITYFLTWLEHTEDKNLKSQPFLEKLLSHIFNHHLLGELCQQLSQNKPLTENKSQWLFEHILATQVMDNGLLQNIALGFSWPWLQEKMKDQSLDQLALLRLTLGQGKHLKAITENNSAKLTLLTLLNECRFPPNELIPLQKNITDITTKALFAAHLLSRKDYLDQLPGENFLENQAEFEDRFDFRLQSMVNQLDLAAIPPEAMKELQPEAAATLLCSVRHFHRLNTSYMEPILQRVGEKNTAFIKYWLIHSANMPNVAKPLVALIKLQPHVVLSQLLQLSEPKRNAHLLTLIQNLDQLPTTTAKNLIMLCDEAHLNYACHLYFYGGQSEDISIQFIQDLTDKILEQKKPLTSRTIQLLIRLSEGEKFDSLREKIGKATSDYLRSSALFADCSIFYDDGHLNIKRMQKHIPLLTGQTDSATQQSYRQTFTKIFKKMLLVKDETPIQFTDTTITMNPLIAVLAKDIEQIKSIDYFLIHYHGKAEALEQCLNHYLNHLELGNRTLGSKQLQTTAWLLNRSEIAMSTRKILFEVFIKHPKLLNEKISASLLTFNADRIVSQFGQKGDYQALIFVCSLGLPSMDEDSDNTRMVQQALQEAEFESSLANITGFLCNFRIWLKRTFFYGWETWFEPKKPKYVIPFTKDNSQDHSASIILQEPSSSNSSIEEVFSIQPTSALKEGLESLLRRVKGNADLTSLQILVDGLAIYDWQTPNSTELDTRKTIDDLFEVLLQRMKSEHSMSTWLPQHFEIFIANRTRLVGLYLEHNQQEKLLDLLSHASKGPGNFNQILTKLSEVKEPELVTDKTIPIVVQQMDVSLLGKVTGTLSSLSSFFWTSPSKNATPDRSVTSTSEKRGWFQGILFK